MVLRTIFFSLEWLPQIAVTALGLRVAIWFLLRARQNKGVAIALIVAGIACSAAWFLMIVGFGTGLYLMGDAVKAATKIYGGW